MSAFELAGDAAVQYFVERELVPASADASAEQLGGGVSNRVVRVSWDGGCLVGKQPLPNLAVEDDWPASVVRVHNEAAAARAYDRILAVRGQSGSRVRVPTVVAEDHESHVIGIECAPPAAASWKRELLDGTVDADVAGTVGRTLGTVHAAAADDADLRAEFADPTPFEQLRVDPYHRTTAERNPDVADAILAEAERVLDTRRTLVHGDYSPKNVLVDRERDETWVLDFEVAHWGDPSFDTAFMLNHLLIKSVYNADAHEEYVGAARTFWERYGAAVPWDVEAETVRELGVLMLARIDGKSPVEYVTRTETKETLRLAAKRVLQSETATLDGVVEVLQEAMYR